MKTVPLKSPLTLPRLLLLPYRVDPGYSFLNLAVNLAGALMGPLRVWAIAAFIDTSVDLFTGFADASDLILPILLLTLSRFFTTVATYLLNIVTARHPEKEWERVEYPLSRRAASLEMKHQEDAALHEELGVYMEGCTALSTQEHLQNMIFRTVSLVSYFAVIGQYVPWLAAVSLLLVIPMCLFSFYTEKDAFANRKTRNTTKLYNKNYRTYLTGRDAAAERNLFDSTPMILEKYLGTLDETFRDNLRLQFHKSKRGYIASIFQYILCFVAVLLLIPMLRGGTITLGIFTSVVQTIFIAIPELVNGFGTDTLFFFQSRRDLALFNKFLGLSADESIVSPAAEDVPAFRSLEFRDVSFTYPGCDKKVLDHVSFTMEAGKTYALVGVNGSGKSTLVKLILRCYDDYEGEIFVNGAELRTCDRAVLKGMFGAIFQNFGKYQISVEDNIRLGAGFFVPEEAVDRAIAVAGLSEVVKKLPDGKKTLLGKLHENGVDLSGGEWQKVAIARLAVNRAGFKILDEPTAALDPLAECDFYKKCDDICRGATTLFISHRLASTKNADTILVLRDGRVAEQGNHRDLMEANGLYAEMFGSQQGWYL